MVKIDTKQIAAIGGWFVFLISFSMYLLTSERTGSLWDCGEFILGAYKLEVVHPPGAPLFLLLGRLFAWMGDILSNDASGIAFAVNIMSGLATALASTFLSWTTMIFARLLLVGRKENDLDHSASFLIAGSGVIAGLAMAFSTSIWFSAVEGEVYALSTFFTALTLWSAAKWYSLPEESENDRWLIFAFYSAGLSVGVHLLSILAFPAITLLWYFKRNKKIFWWESLLAVGVGCALIGAIQLLIITGIPVLWANLELLTVNTTGLPFHSGLIPLLLIIAGLLSIGFVQAHRWQSPELQKFMIALSLIIISYSVIAVIPIRANAGPPINMSKPSDAHRLLPYLNREQYGERPLLKGPYWGAQPMDIKVAEKYGQVGSRYEVTDYTAQPLFRTSDEMLFPEWATGMFVGQKCMLFGMTVKLVNLALLTT